MSTQELRQARETYAALRELVTREVGGWDDPASRTRIAGLVTAASALLDDAECQERLRAIQAHAADLYSYEAHLKWTRKGMSGADYLRLQILIGLEAINTRLLYLEALRESRHAPC